MEITNPINDRREKWYLVIIFLSSVLFFIPNLGKVHLFDWDEINFAESAREMIVTHNYHRVMINFQPFWEKPPLFFWLQTVCMHIFGINEFAARLPNALFGIITLLTIYFIGKKEKSPAFGFFWAISFLGTILPYVYFKSGIIDPVFNYFIFTGVYCMYRAIKEPDKKNSIWWVALAGTLIGLSNLTKGPVGLLMFLITFGTWFIFRKVGSFSRREGSSPPTYGNDIRKIVVFLVCFGAVTFFWFGMEVINNGFWFLKEFLGYQVDLFRNPVAGHEEPIYYHFLVVFLGCFPISVLALPVLFRRNTGDLRSFPLVMKILFWTVMILFTIVTTKIVHYSSLSYLPLSFIASLYIEKLLAGAKPNRYILWMLALTGLIFCILLTALPLIAEHPHWLMSKLKDPVAIEALKLPVHWNGYEFLLGVGYFAGIIISLIIIIRRHIKTGLMVLFYSTSVFLFFYLVNVVPKIEAYSQGTVINFYKSIAGQDVYVTPVAFKSYAHYFYFDKRGPSKFNAEDSLMTGPIDKPAYFVVKINNKTFDSACSQCRLIKTEGGYRFYRRDPKK